MTTPTLTCSQCTAGPFTEREAMMHECGIEPPEPTLADIPMTMREGVTILANQLANVADQIRRAAAAFEKFADAYHETLHREFPLLYPPAERREVVDAVVVEGDVDAAAGEEDARVGDGRDVRDH